jgi:hypothetical protein
MATRAYRAEMGEPPMPDEGAPGPMTKKQRLGKMVIGKSSDVTPEERKKIMRDMPMEPVPGEKKFAKGGSASSRADGCAKRGKTRGMMV